MSEVTFYAYVNNNPINANDPTGMASVSQAVLDIIKSFKPGPFAGEGVQLPTNGQRATAQIQRDINAQGETYGCHICGADTPGTASGNWVLDHMQPTALSNGQPQVGYPSCINCSNIQGGYVSAAVKAAAGAIGLGAAGDANASNGGSFGSYLMNAASGVKNFLIDTLTDPRTYYAPLILFTPSSAGEGSDVVPRISPSVSPSAFNNSSFSFGVGSGAAGGYLLYPNKPNNNQMQAVYSK